MATVKGGIYNENKTPHTLISEQIVKIPCQSPEAASIMQSIKLLKYHFHVVWHERNTILVITVHKTNQ